MRVADLLKRARSAAGRGCGYGLGAGAQVPTAYKPWDENEECDCSAFVCWSLGLSKQQSLAWLKPVNGGWFNTDGIWWDALFERSGFFSALGILDQTTQMAASPGNVIVYPSRSLAQRKGYPKHTAKIGHVGIVTEVNSGKVTKVIHCSAGNERQLGDAIAETDPKVFQAQPSTILALCALVEA